MRTPTTICARRKPSQPASHVLPAAKLHHSFPPPSCPNNTPHTSSPDYPPGCAHWPAGARPRERAPSRLPPGVHNATGPTGARPPSRLPARCGQVGAAINAGLRERRGGKGGRDAGGGAQVGGRGWGAGRQVEETVYLSPRSTLEPARLPYGGGYPPPPSARKKRDRRCISTLTWCMHMSSLHTSLPYGAFIPFIVCH